MPYTDFADEANCGEMARQWGVPYQTVQRVARLVDDTPSRLHHNIAYYDRESQQRLGVALETYVKYPKLLFREEKLHRAVVAADKERRETRLMDHIEKAQKEIAQLRAQLRALSTPDDDDGLLARLVHLASLDKAGFASLAHAALDTDLDAALVVDGALKLLGVILDAGLRKADNRVLTKAQTMTVYTALSTLAELGRMADTRLTQYAGVADARVARHQTPDTRTPEKAEVTP